MIIGDDLTASVDLAETLPNFFRQAGYDALAFGKVFHNLPTATALQMIRRLQRPFGCSDPR